MPQRSSVRRLAVLADDMLRPSHISAFNRPGLAPFSTTAGLHAKKLISRGEAPKKGRRTLNLKSKKRERDTNPPAPGERKAFRTRIVLSNTNAIEVPTLKHLEADTLMSESSLGSVYALPDQVVDQLRHIGAFKRGQGWQNFHRPACLVRAETLELARLADSITVGPKQINTSRRIIHGPRKSGKSVLLLQAMASAFLKGWVVINIPEARELVDARYDYQPVKDTWPVQFTQPEATAALLSRIAQGNRKVLSTIKPLHSQQLPIRAVGHMNLLEVVEAGARQRDIAWAVFQAFWKDMGVEGRPPILFCADNISFLFNPTAYQILDECSNRLKKVHPFNLLLVKHSVELFSGSRALPNGGMALGATSLSQHAFSAPLEVSLELAEARRNNPQSQVKLSDIWNPLVDLDRCVLDELANLRTIKLGGITKEHSKGMMEYWARSGLVRDDINDSYVGQKWTLAGGGVIGELERAVIEMNMS